MDVVQSYSIAYKGLKTGVHDFRFEVGKALFEAFQSPDIKDGNCVAEIRMDRQETMLQLHIRITGDVTVPCDRCLEDCHIPIDYEADLLVKFSDEVHNEDFDGEVMWLLNGEDELNLAQYIYESVVLSLPYQRVHPEGECNPEMLRRFRIVSGEDFAAIEAAAEAEKPTSIGESDRSKLSQLKARMEAESKGEQA